MLRIVCSGTLARVSALSLLLPLAFTGIATSSEFTFTFTPVADAQIQMDKPWNSGTAATMRVRAGSPEYRSYLKFVPSGVSDSVLSARLRVYCVEPSDDGGSVYRVENGWTELGITSLNAPAISGDSLAAGGPAEIDTWVEFDVTSVVQSGDTVSFALKSGSTNNCTHSTREGVAPPQLVVQFEAIPSAPPTITLVAPSSGREGTEILVLGSNFIDVTGVAFNGTSASFVVDSPKRLHATVPLGATSGPVSVTNTVGTGATAEDFDVLPQSAGSTLAFLPTADAHVHSGHPGSNYGSATILRARGDSTEYQFYLKFDLQGIVASVQNAKIRLYVADPSPSGGSMFVASNEYSSTPSSWDETGIKWSNAPALSGDTLATQDTVYVDTWVEFDVTPAVTGNGILSFGVQGGSRNSVYYSSKEGAHPPVLELQVADAVAGVSTPGPTSFEVQGARPNPFSRNSAIEYSLARPGHVRLRIYDVAGKLVRTLVDQARPAGLGRAEWDGADAAGHHARAGLYLYRLEFDGQSRGGKLFLRR